MRGLAINLENVTECFAHLGQLDQARAAAAESLAIAQAHGTPDDISRSGIFLAWVAGLAGDTAEAERQFTVADQVKYDGISGYHVYSAAAVWWAEWLARTGREGPARTLIASSASTSRQHGWIDDLARCDRTLGRLDLAAGDVAAAGGRLAYAAAMFRRGDLLIELAVTLADLADHARVVEDLDAAEQYATEAITIAAPRGLLPAQSGALAARARIRAVRAGTDPDLLYQGRDAADAALRLASRHQLAWHELDALRAHAALDHAEGSDRGWAAKADARHARLVPPGLDPDPPTTVERLAAARKAAKASDRGGRT